MSGGSSLRQSTIVSTFLLCCIYSTCAEAAWSTYPSTVIFEVPFTLTNSGIGTSDMNIYLSNTSNCADAITPMVPLNSGSATFTVSVEIDTAYVCDATQSPLYSISINFLTFTPAYAFTSTPQTLAFSSLTPIGAVVNVTQYSDCTGEVYSTTTVNGSLQTTVVLTTNGFVCVGVEAVAENNAVVSVDAGKILVSQPISFTPTIAIDGQATEFLLSGAAPTDAAVLIGLSPSCDNASVTYTAGGQYGTSFTATLDIPRGPYFFCVAISSTIFALVGTLIVERYGATPTDAFAGEPMVFYLTKDSPLNTTTIISSTDACTDSLVGPLSASPTTGALPSLTLVSNGTFFICVEPVEGSSSYVVAAVVTVLNLPVVSILTNPAVRGLSETLTVTPLPSYNIALASAGTSCATPYAEMTTYNYSVSFSIDPTGMLASVSTVDVCVYVPNTTVAYPIASLGLRAFTLTYSALMVGERNLTLDNETSIGQLFTLSQSPSCSPTLGTNYTVESATRTVAVTFPSAATYYVCLYSSVPPYLVYDVGSLSVAGIPTLSLNTTLLREDTTIVVSSAAPGSVIYIDATCAYSSTAPPLFVGLPTTSTFVFNVTFAATGTYEVCANYTNSAAMYEPFTVGHITVGELTVAPVFFAPGVRASVTFTATVGPSTINTYFFLTAALTCAVVVQPIYPIINSVGNFTPSEPGSFTICVQTYNGASAAPYFPASNVTVLYPPAAAIVEAYGALDQIPFQVNVSVGSYAPVSWFVAAGLSNCEAPQDDAQNGTFGGASDNNTGWILLPLGEYTFCIAAPDGQSFLYGFAFNVTQYTCLSTSLIAGGVPNISTTPALPYAFELSTSPTCDPASTSYAISPTAALNAPVGTYTLCAMGSIPVPWVSPASNPVLLLHPFSATIPGGVRVNVPFNMTVSTSTTGLVHVYIIPGVGEPCNVHSDVPLAAFTGLSSTEVTVTVPAVPNVTVCAVSGDGTIAADVGSIVPLPYTNPGVIVLGVPTNVQAGVNLTGVVRLTTDPLCADPIGPANRTLVQGVVMGIDIPPGVVTQPFLYWCQAATAAGPFLDMDTIQLLAPPNVSIETPPPATPVPGTQWSPPSGVLQPGEPFNISVPPYVGTNPFLSTYSNCSDVVNYTFGIFPRAGESAAFFVCVTSPGGVVFTSAVPTLTVANFQMTPSFGVISLEIQVEFFPSLARFVGPGGYGVYFAPSPDCTSPILGPVTTLDTPVLFPEPGTFWACYGPDGTAADLVGVASLVVYAPPTASLYLGTWRSFPLCFNLTSATYSVVSGVDSAAGPQTARQVWLVPLPSSSSSSALTTSNQTVVCTAANAVTEPIAVTSNESICIVDTAGLNASSSYALCAPTPVVNVVVAAGLQFPNVSLSINELVVDAVTVVQATPNVVSGSLFSISGSGGGGGQCAAPVAPYFPTNATGFLAINLTAQSFFATTFVAGTYDLCLYSSVTQQNYSVGVVSLFAPVYFGISNPLVTVLVPTMVMLLGDLSFADLVGFSPSPSCSGASNVTAVVYPTSAPDLVQVYYPSDSNTTMYLCARAPVNGSIVAVAPPLAFGLPVLQFPASASACEPIFAGFVSGAAALAQAPDTVVALYPQPCCLAGVSSAVGAVAVASPTTDYVATMVVTAADLAAVAPQHTFDLCVSSASLGVCEFLGPLTITPGQCIATPAPAVLTSSGASLPPGSLLSVAAVYGTSSNVVAIVVLAACYALVLIVALLLCTLLASRCRKVIPEDETVPVDGWRRVPFDRLFKINRLVSSPEPPVVSSLHVMHTVPLDMQLDICKENATALQRLMWDEEAARDELAAAEAFVRDRLRFSYDLEGQDVAAQTVLAERAVLMDSVVAYWEEQFARFVEVESLARDELAAAEEQERLRLVRVEREEWERRMESEGRRLEKERDAETRQRWNSGKRRVMERASQMLTHLDPSSALPGRYQQSSVEEVTRRRAERSTIDSQPPPPLPPTSRPRVQRTMSPVEDPEEDEPYVAPPRPWNPFRVAPDPFRRPASVSPIPPAYHAPSVERSRRETLPPHVPLDDYYERRE